FRRAFPPPWADMPMPRRMPAEEHDTAQFEIADDRDVDQMIAAIEAQGYQPVCKSWEPLDEAYACGKSA
ncbi:hypothetical protein HMPREF0178_03896, partial [Bilophila sp. 4_1_30]